MRSLNIDQGWQFQHQRIHDGFPDSDKEDSIRKVNLPHDYMIESNVTEDAAAGSASGFYTESVASYTKHIEIPQAWEQEEVYLHFDGVMMNATVEINGSKAVLQHNGYIPFSVNITPYIYFGKTNRVTVIVNPSMQPNSRWYTGAGIFRSVELLHMPKLHIANDGILVIPKKLSTIHRELLLLLIFTLRSKYTMKRWKIKLHWWRYILPKTEMIKSSSAANRKCRSTLVQLILLT